MAPGENARQALQKSGAGHSGAWGVGPQAPIGEVMISDVSTQQDYWAPQPCCFQINRRNKPGCQDCAGNAGVQAWIGPDEHLCPRVWARGLFGCEGFHLLRLLKPSNEPPEDGGFLTPRVNVPEAAGLCDD